MLKKDDFARKIKEELQLSSMKDASAVLNGFSKIITEVLESGDGVTLPGIGKLEVVTRSPRKGHNPITGESIEIPEKKAVRFKATSAIKEAVNK